MASKKPALPPANDRGFGAAIKECLERLMGRRGGRVEKVPGLGSSAVTAGPTAAEYNALRDDVDVLRVRLNALLDQVEDFNG